MTHLYAGGPSLDAAFRALCAAPRRWTVRYLLNGSGVLGVAELVDRLQADLTGRSGSDSEADDFTRLDRQIGLVHVHLPLLEEVGVIEFDRRSRTVVATEAMAALDPLLAATSSFEGGRRADLDSANAGDENVDRDDAESENESVGASGGKGEEEAKRER